jgi:tRNA threonylcarbamoyladenosine biosynthesis protein TsaB
MEKKTQRTVEKILAVETSGRLFSLALAASDGAPAVKGEIAFDAGTRHSEMLREACEFLLRGCGWKKEDLTALAVSTGPGSFTGLRVGIAFARALAQALGLPLVGVTAFEVIAKGLPAGPAPRAVLIDSIGQDLFVGFFAPGKTRPQKAYRVEPLAALAAELARGPRRTLAGPGALRYGKELRRALGKKFDASAPEACLPRAKDLAALALERLGRSRPAADSRQTVVPFYLRAPVAVERLDYRRKSAAEAPQRKKT